MGNWLLSSVADVNWKKMFPTYAPPDVVFFCYFYMIFIIFFLFLCHNYY